MKRTILAGALAAMLFGGMGTQAQAAKRGDPPCSISPSTATVGQAYVVSASGLPTTTTLNLWTVNPSGQTTGMPLGTVASGAISYSTSAPSAGTWTYEVTGTNFNKLYSSCSIQVS